MGEKKILKAAIRHAEELRATQEEALKIEKTAKKRPREEAKPVEGRGKRTKR